MRCLVAFSVRTLPGPFFTSSSPRTSSVGSLAKFFQCSRSGGLYHGPFGRIFFHKHYRIHLFCVPSRIRIRFFRVLSLGGFTSTLSHQPFRSLFRGGLFRGLFQGDFLSAHDQVAFSVGFFARVFYMTSFPCAFSVSFFADVFRVRFFAGACSMFSSTRHFSVRFPALV